MRRPARAPSASCLRVKEQRPRPQDRNHQGEDHNRGDHKRYCSPRLPSGNPGQIARQVIGSVADLVYVIVSVEAGSVGPLLGSAVGSWSLIRVTVGVAGGWMRPALSGRNPCLRGAGGSAALPVAAHGKIRLLVPEACDGPVLRGTYPGRSRRGLAYPNYSLDGARRSGAVPAMGVVVDQGVENGRGRMIHGP